VAWKAVAFTVARTPFPGRPTTEEVAGYSLSMAKGPDLHRDKLGIADQADRRALRDLRVVAPIAILIGLLAWLAGAGPLALVPVPGIIAGFVQWRAASIRRRVRREYAAKHR
jgi:hypothetical protein